MSALRCTWRDHRRVVLTFSQPTLEGVTAAARAATQAARHAGLGYTLSDAEGGWQGTTESAASLAFVGRAEPPFAVLRALIGAGCEAVQVERHDSPSYAVEEWRAS